MSPMLLTFPFLFSNISPNFYIFIFLFKFNIFLNFRAHNIHFLFCYFIWKKLFLKTIFYPDVFQRQNFNLITNFALMISRRKQVFLKLYYYSSANNSSCVRFHFESVFWFLINKYFPLFFCNTNARLKFFNLIFFFRFILKPAAPFIPYSKKDKLFLVFFNLKFI